MSKESPIFLKTFDLIKQVIQLTERFPKSQRFFLARRINDSSFDFYDKIVEAAVIRDKRISDRLQEADAELFKLPHYMRLAMEVGYVSVKQYKAVAERLAEMGRLLGGWMKKNKK